MGLFSSGVRCCGLVGLVLDKFVLVLKLISEILGLEGLEIFMVVFLFGSFSFNVGYVVFRL